MARVRSSQARRFPTTAHLRLAHVVTGPTAVTRVADERIQCMVAGSGLGFVSKAGDTMSGPLTVAATTSGPTSTAVVVADPINRLIGFFGATPATQAPALPPLRFPAGSTTSDTIADVGSSFSQQTLNNNFASLAAKVDRADHRLAASRAHGQLASGSDQPERRIDSCRLSLRSNHPGPRWGTPRRLGRGFSF